MYSQKCDNIGYQTGGDDYDFEETNDDMDDEGEEPCESDEDTEEASENEFRRYDPPPQSLPSTSPVPVPPKEAPREVPDLKEQIYQEKLSHLKGQLQLLAAGTLPEYLKKVKKLEQQFKERLRLNNIYREHAMDLAEKDYIAEKRAASKEYEEKTVEMKENLIQDLEEKRKNIESERLSMELAGDLTETKPPMTRKLRRRPNDPAPVPEKRGRKIASLPSQVNFLLDEKDIDADLKAITRGNKNLPSARKPSNGSQSLGPITPEPPTSEVKIEDGKLLFERKWFHRGQTVFVEGKDHTRFPAIISAVGTETIHVKKTTDSSKVKIYLSQLVKGKFIIKRRAS